MSSVTKILTSMAAVASTVVTITVTPSITIDVDVNVDGSGLHGGSIQRPGDHVQEPGDPVDPPCKDTETFSWHENRCSVERVSCDSGSISLANPDDCCHKGIDDGDESLIGAC